MNTSRVLSGWAGLLLCAALPLLPGAAQAQSALDRLGFTQGPPAEGNKNVRPYKGPKPEDLLKGQLFVSDRSFPSSWKSPSEFASRVKAMNKSSFFYDRKTGKVQVYYAAFFAQPVDDVQVNFIIYDITQSPHQKKGSWEAFLGRAGERTLFNSVELDKEDIEMNKKYLFAVEYRRKIIASGQVILRGEGPKYSGKVEFTEEEVKKKE